MIGKTLGHYQITSQLGKGGMGEVYQAKDGKLGRDVAIKVLPEEFANDADRIARFQREAKLLASLNHPNIAAIYGLEESSGTKFLVLELVDGNTLADRIKAGPVPVEEVLKLALQIAEALEAAHEKGVIHRDLKPANIKVTPDGKVKVLDFGLAKAYAGGHEEMVSSDSPTLTMNETQKGVILGTAAYMSPEQARGKAVDKRADIWAFGCVLFEMLAGRDAFSGDDISDIFAAIIRAEPEWASLPANLHWRLREIIERCLKKDARDRYHDISDVRIDIQKVMTDSSGVLVPQVKTVGPRRKLLWIAAAIVLTAIIAGVTVWKLRPSEPRRVMRFDYQLPEGQQFGSPFSLAVSPDGSQFIYPTNKGLYLRSVDALDARLIDGTAQMFGPIFSPDGHWIACFSRLERKLKKIAVRGGAPMDLCYLSRVSNTSWDSDDTIVYDDAQRGIFRVSANGGTPEPIIKANFADIEKDGFPTVPQILPDGKTLLFTKVFGMNVADYQVTVQSLRSGERKVLFKGGLAARYLPTGHIVYTLPKNSGNNLFAIPFDLNKLEVTGEPVSMMESISTWAFSNSGTLVYVPQPAIAAASMSAATFGNTLVWVDRQGKEESLGAEPDAHTSIGISPDGTQVASSISTGTNKGIWIWDIARKTQTKLTFDAGDDSFPVWTHDGKRIVFFSMRRGGVLGNLVWKSVDGFGEAEPLDSQPAPGIIPASLSHDGKTLMFYEFSLSTGGSDIGMMSLEGTRERKALLHEKHMESEPQISPDGRWMAYQSNESGKEEIYVRPFPDVNKGKWQVSNGGGVSPLWSRDGRELFYRNGDVTMSVKVEADPTFKRGNPEILFRGTYISVTSGSVTRTPWDIHPDGKRFLMIKPPASAGAASTATVTQPKITIVVNWFEELKRRVPVK